MKALLVFLLVVTPTPLVAQRRDSGRDRDSVQTRILKRWVGAKVNGLPLWFDFFSDTMLVVSDNARNYPVDYALTPRNLIIYGDTALSHMLHHVFHRFHDSTEAFVPTFQFGLRYRFSLEKLLIEDEDNVTITMTEQNPLARPIEARWIADLPDSSPDGTLPIEKWGCIAPNTPRRISRVWQNGNGVPGKSSSTGRPTLWRYLIQP